MWTWPNIVNALYIDLGAEGFSRRVEFAADNGTESLKIGMIEGVHS